MPVQWLQTHTTSLSARKSLHIFVLGHEAWLPQRVGYYFRLTGGPLTRLPLRLTETSTRSAILMKGMPLFMPYCLRSKAMIPEIVRSQSLCR